MLVVRVLEGGQSQITTCSMGQRADHESRYIDSIMKGPYSSMIFCVFEHEATTEVIFEAHRSHNVAIVKYTSTEGRWAQ
jgi:hypothetical protein